VGIPLSHDRGIAPCKDQPALNKSFSNSMMKVVKSAFLDTGLFESNIKSSPQIASVVRPTLFVETGPT
jgi:hypothetical protein